MNSSCTNCYPPNVRLSYFQDKITNKIFLSYCLFSIALPGAISGMCPCPVRDCGHSPSGAGMCTAITQELAPPLRGDLLRVVATAIVDSPLLHEGQGGNIECGTSVCLLFHRGHRHLGLCTANSAGVFASATSRQATRHRRRRCSRSLECLLMWWPSDSSVCRQRVALDESLRTAGTIVSLG